MRVPKGTKEKIVSVPLRGSGSEIALLLYGPDILQMSFRPLAGFWFLNDGLPLDWCNSPEFPSPCGVLVLKLS